MNLLQKLLCTLLYTSTLVAPVVGTAAGNIVGDEKFNIAGEAYKDSAIEYLNAHSELSEKTKKRIVNYMQSISEEILDKVTHELTLYESKNEISIYLNSSVNILCNDMLDKNIITENEAKIILNNTRDISYEDLSPEAKEILQEIYENKTNSEFLKGMAGICGLILVFEVITMLPINYSRHYHGSLFSFPIALTPYGLIWWD